MITLRYLLEQEFFIVCPVMPASAFVDFCRKRGVDTSEKELEQLERVAMVRPSFRRGGLYG